MKPKRKTFALFLFAGGAALVGPLLLGGGADLQRGTTRPDMTGAPVLADPEATARRLLEDWLSALDGFESPAPFLAANYQIQRADGSGANRQQFLENPATVHDFKVGDGLIAGQANNTLVVTWDLTVTETISGRFMDDVTADRLTVFEWIDVAWRIVGYGNFNPVETSQKGGTGGEQEGGASRQPKRSPCADCAGEGPHGGADFA